MQLGEVHRMGLLRVWDVDEADAVDDRDGP
jgi:hypothetical protein